MLGQLVSYNPSQAHFECDFSIVCVHLLYMHERGRCKVCIYTPYNDCVVGAMVTHQMGSVMGAAVLHLLSETLLYPLLSYPLLIFD